MKKISFVGAYDKTDLLIYLSKIMVLNGKKVLIIDATTLQKTRYTVPCIAPSKSYITTHEDIDIAVGFENFDEITEYTQTPKMEYDYILIDVDTQKEFDAFSIANSDKIYFVTGFDNYSLKKGLEIIGKREEKILMTKVLFSRNMEVEDDEYLNFLSYYSSIKWDKEKIFFPFEVGDNSVIIENQRNTRISFKELSTEFKDGMLQILAGMSTEIKTGWIKKILKNL